MEGNRLDLPFGPLTRADFETLGLSYYDGALLDRQRQAAERSVGRGDYLALKLSELTVGSLVEPTSVQ